ncbi:MAG: mechanosensitive ion channel protein MscS, partial [Paracoccaceae bacterium]
MNRTSPGRKRQRLSLVNTLLAAGLALLMALAGPLAAQEAAPAPSDTGRLAPLIDVLKDETARNALIAELERAATASGVVPEAKENAAATEKPDLSIGRRIARVTTDIAQGTAAQLTALWSSLSGAGNVFDGLRGNEVEVLLGALKQLLLVIVLTVAVFLVLRRLFIPIYRRMGTRAGDSGAVRTGLLWAGSAVMDILIVVAAWAIGYAVTVLAVGEFGQIGIRQSLYLNAFLLVELVKAVMRAFFSPTSDGLRLLPLSDAAALRTNRHTNVVVSVLGYGQLLIVPIVNQSVSYAAGRSVSAILAIFVLLYLVYLVIRNRRGVAEWMLTRLAPPVFPDGADGGTEPPVGSQPAPSDTGEDTAPRPNGMLATLARNWHWFTLIYLAVMFAVVMTSPARVVYSALGASGKIAVALLVAALLAGALSRAMARGITLPEDVTQRLPLLEPRLNSFVPRVLFILRYLIL